MHIALFIDEERLAHEQSMLNRLCVGLLAEGCSVTRIVPETAVPDTVGEAERRIALAPRLEWPVRVLPWMRRARAMRLALQMERSVPDVIYAVGQRAWTPALELAAALGKPAALDVCSMAQASIVPRAKQTELLCGYIASTNPIAQATGKRVGDGLVCVVRPGVAVPDHPRDVFSDPDQPWGVAVIGKSRDVNAYAHMLTGLDRLRRDGRSMHVFLELSGPNEHEIWRRVERMDLLGCVSSIGDASGYRKLLTRCDLLLLPERIGELRSIMLEGMAFGIPLIAAADPALDMLTNQQTAYLIQEQDRDGWTEVLNNVPHSPTSFREIGHKGRRLIQDQFTSSGQVQSLASALERAVSGGSYKIHAQSA